MPRIRDPRAILWVLLGLWVGIELLYSSRWWPPAAGPVSQPSPAPDAASTLQALIQPRRSARVWFAPYTPFPEAGYVESTARRGVYDTLLAIPADAGTAVNYGASKLTPADTLFSLVSAHGLDAELRLARSLGYGFFALDLGAVTDPTAATRLCQKSAGCSLSSDAYALFPIPTNKTAVETGLKTLQRRIPLLPMRSSGPSWGTLVFSPFDWTEPQVSDNPSQPGLKRLTVHALPHPVLEIYRYPLQRFPSQVRSRLQLGHQNVQLQLAPGIQSAQICLRKAPGRFWGAPIPCRRLGLTAQQPSAAIGDWITPGEVTQISIDDIEGLTSGPGPLTIEVD